MLGRYWQWRKVEVVDFKLVFWPVRNFTPLHSIPPTLYFVFFRKNCLYFILFILGHFFPFFSTSCLECKCLFFSIFFPFHLRFPIGPFLFSCWSTVTPLFSFPHFFIFPPF